MVELICDYCGKKFERRKAEVNRSKRLDRKQYCSRKCQGCVACSHLSKNGNTNNLQANNRKDQYSPFRWHLRNAKRRRECTITLEDLKEQWDKQKGICPYTGWRLKNAPTMNERLDHTPNRASLDRIDSSKGYIPGNIQFISLMAQYAKNGWGDEELINFCEAVQQNLC